MEPVVVSQELQVPSDDVQESSVDDVDPTEAEIVESKEEVNIADFTLAESKSGRYWGLG